jgi:hypothetical protein
MLESFYNINIPSNITRQHCHDCALMTAAHILVCLTQDGKTIEEIAKQDFDDNIELVSVWADYLLVVGWMRNTHVNSKNKWMASNYGKEWVEKVMNPYLYHEEL